MSNLQFDLADHGHGFVPELLDGLQVEHFLVNFNLLSPPLSNKAQN
ncbi:MAG: hypothetical protein JRF56_19670 [Deltaproteobacteria bacterium]|jgi:hypothetical protein|nr:hypothetical protein [Deltaproteobacteria bacterium]